MVENDTVTILKAGADAEKINGSCPGKCTL